MRSIATALAVVLSLSACATPDGVGGTGVKQVVGGIGGAALGGLAGSQFGHGTGKLAMTGLGVLLGGLLGGAGGSALDRSDQAALDRNTQAALNTRQPVGQPIVWDNPQNGNQVIVTPTREGHSGGSYCREYRQTVIVSGKKQQGYGQACRQPDGSWKIVE